MSAFVWGILPYLCLTSFVVGSVWRYRYDKFGWTTRSSQLYESRLLRWGSPMFHFGIIGVGFGHVVGLVIPKGWTASVGISDHVYHLVAVIGGVLAGVATVLGLAILIYRRRAIGPVFSVTTRMDKLMYVFLASTILLGMWNTIGSSILGEYDYRSGVSEWFRSVFLLQPQPDLMVAAPLSFQVHALVSTLLFGLWPFTRLVHVFSAPIGYLTRPYIVYRSRAPRVVEGLGNRSPQRGWERPSLQRR